MRPQIVAVLTLSASLLVAHPLGNFSVNHYMKFEAAPQGIEMRYVIDLAEIPTFEMLREWDLDRGSPRQELERKAEKQAQTWAGNLSIHAGGKPVQPLVEGGELVIAD